MSNRVLHKIFHAVVLAIFGFGCWFAWVLLNLSTKVLEGTLGNGTMLPGMTLLCLRLRPGLLALPVLAVVYCCWVWLSRNDRTPSCLGFFGLAMGILSFIVLLTTAAILLPIIHVLR